MESKSSNLIHNQIDGSPRHVNFQHPKPPSNLELNNNRKIIYRKSYPGLGSKRPYAVQQKVSEHSFLILEDF